MATAITNRIMASTDQIAQSGPMNLNHLLYGTLQMASAAMISPEVGATTFVKASPSWNASTEVCLVTPSMSARGAMNGIVIAA